LKKLIFEPKLLDSYLIQMDALRKTLATIKSRFCEELQIPNRRIIQIEKFRREKLGEIIPFPEKWNHTEN
jgi:hypothetical protein